MRVHETGPPWKPHFLRAPGSAGHSEPLSYMTRRTRMRVLHKNYEYGTPDSYDMMRAR